MSKSEKAMEATLIVSPAPKLKLLNGNGKERRKSVTTLHSALRDVDSKKKTVLLFHYVQGVLFCLKMYVTSPFSLQQQSLYNLALRKSEHLPSNRLPAPFITLRGLRAFFMCSYVRLPRGEGSRDQDTRKGAYCNSRDKF